MASDGLRPPQRKLKGTSLVHLDHYKDVGLEYPPKLENYPQDIQDIANLVNQAAAEVLIYAEETEPYPLERGVPQFADINPSLTLLIGNKADSSIYKTFIPTLTTGCQLVMRVELKDGTKKWRLVASCPV